MTSAVKSSYNPITDDNHGSFITGNSYVGKLLGIVLGKKALGQF